jgi:hypothetical protein
MSSTDNERLLLSVGRVRQEFEHESVAHEIGGRHAERRLQRKQLRRRFVGRSDLTLDDESEEFGVEAL